MKYVISKPEKKIESKGGRKDGRERGMDEERKLLFLFTVFLCIIVDLLLLPSPLCNINWVYHKQVRRKGAFMHNSSNNFYNLRR